MTEQNILDILKMRIAVYQCGIASGLWNSIDTDGASDMMNYIFPKSGQIAYYNLVLEFMRKNHSELPRGAYFLFKLPVQVEKEIMDYLKKNRIDMTQIVPDGESYLLEMDTIVTDHIFGNVNIGAYRPDNIDNILRLCASHYRYAFQNKIESFPFLL